MRHTYVLGLNAYHADSSACLLRDGELVAAAEEERFRRVKHWAGIPSQAAAYCLSEEGIAPEQVQHIAINTDPRAHLGRKLAYLVFRRPDLGLVRQRLRNQRKRLDVMIELAQQGLQFSGAKLHRIEHHAAHLASAYFVSPYDRATVVSVDGFGDFASTAWGLGEGNRLQLDGQVFFPQSLGLFYQALTQYLGFTQYGDEYKVMGLAPYGEPRYLKPLRILIRQCKNGGFALDPDYFRHMRESVPYTWEGGIPEVGSLYTDKLCKLLGPPRYPNEVLDQRHKDIARSVQALYEEFFFDLLNEVYRRHGAVDLALAGGCAMNSVANGKITIKTPFRNVYVQAAAGDAGGAIGAAIALWRQLAPNASRFRMPHAYWGPSASSEEVDAVLKQATERLQDAGCDIIEFTDEAQLCRQTAQAIAQGGVIGWFQGRMEWGPRALGNRSILCDPRRADMKQILNDKIKRRESFRPFAPSILREAVAEWFELDAEVPFMTQVYPIRQDKRQRIPAVTHVDGSGRLQTVTATDNLRYYRLIEAFRDLTGVPMVLNTSFNENEPVVCKPIEALDCFLRTRMDMLVLGNSVIKRSSADGAQKAQRESRDVG